MDGTIDIRGLRSLEETLTRRAPEAARRAIRHALVRCGMVAKRDSVQNAPRSPTMKQLSATLKRKRHTARRTTPGGLEKSIELQTTDTEARVFVSSNSFAGKYARRIHDEKGITWRNRGPGTVVKGPQADEKFIERAVRAHVDNGDFGRVFDSEMQKELARL